MLFQLSISNFAIIRHLDITLGPGLNILSGETGAGKSIIINAVNLILGARASSDLIRSGCKEARVEALFSFPENRFLKDTMSELGFPFDGELLIKRDLFKEGRNRIIINGSIATLQMLSRLGAVLISISGQHEHQLLLKPENHLYVLDDFGGLSDERLRLAKAFDRHQALKREKDALEREIREIGEREELTRYQIQEIERAAVSPGEEEALIVEKRRLQHAEELLTIASDGYQDLYENEGSVLSILSRHARRVDKGAEADPGLIVVRDSLAEIEVKMEDAAFALRSFRDSIEIDPLRLEEVAERLELLNMLKRKYGPTLEKVLLFRDKLASAVSRLDRKGEERDRLAKEIQAMEAEMTAMAEVLSKKRKQAAGKFAGAVERELRQLHMADVRFQVGFHPPLDAHGGPEEGRVRAIGADGIDRVEFMISPNVGEELRPLTRIASGGELSRVMLAVKTILARAGSVETIIFDEVDSGISGATAEVVGEKLLALAGYDQVVCITHLPQIASQGNTHFLVRKEVSDGRTQATIAGLDPEERVREIARLLGGRNITPSAVARAREMLG